VAEEGRGENEVVQPVNPAANATANAPANPVANAPANNPANATGNVVNNTANAANVQANVALNPRHNAGAQPHLIQANRAEGSQHHRVRDEVKIARRANYDRKHGVPDALDANNPSRLQISGSCTTKNSCDLLSKTKTTALPTTSTSSLWLMPLLQARERSTIS
jgi:hypothetical protein